MTIRRWTSSPAATPRPICCCGCARHRHTAAPGAGRAEPPEPPAPATAPVSAAAARPVASTTAGVPATAPGPGRHEDPRAFLLAVMNDPAAPLALRIEAAKGLLQAPGHAG